MEGNDCYKFSTIRNYVERAGQPGVEVIIDAGVNVGDVTLMIRDYFPAARIYGFEPVREYFEIARARVANLPGVKLSNRALSAQQEFYDDAGRTPRARPAALKILKGTPEAGPGWAGGSMVLPDDHELIARGGEVPGFERREEAVSALTLAEFMREENLTGVDLLKMDCEGCEHSVLGCADVVTLRAVRFIVGEYHGLERFYAVMKNKLFLTHKVSLIGDRSLGCFFAERLDGERDGILRFDKTGMLVPRPWLCDTPIDWHLFNEEYVLSADRRAHALP